MIDSRNVLALSGSFRRDRLRARWKGRHLPQTDFTGGTMALDKIDRKILALLQRDATTPVAEIGRKVGLSTTPCWRRIQKMEEDGVIKGRVAILDPGKINAGVTVFVSIRTNEHNDAWMRKFSGVVEDLTEVVEFYRMSGEVDYLLRVVVPDIAAYDAFYKKLISRINLTDVSSSFAMGQIKYTTALPLEFVHIPDDDK
jgi:Lrp/AsnC family transcriptional regulator